MLSLLLALSLPAPLHAAPASLAPAFEDAADEFGVPEDILLALAYEASHWRPEVTSEWGGSGLFDLREEGSGPTVEGVALGLGVSPDRIIDSPRQQVRGAAALLAEQGRLSNGGELPPRDDLLAWWDAVRAFSGRHSPELQGMYARYVFELIDLGVPYDEQSGLELVGEPLDIWELAPPSSSMLPACDYAGCAQFISASSSNYSNYSRAGSDIKYVVIHTVQGSYSGCISWFQNSSASVSAHYVVRSSDGEVTQMVYEEDVAWHAGNWSYNEASVGIEHEGYVSDPGTWYTEAMYRSSADLTADIISRTSASASRSSIIAHSEVPGATHTDPGSGWDWDKYMSYIDEALGGGGSTGNLIGVVADSDIYNGARLAGATVWIEETGDSTTADGDGVYYFEGLPLDGYTVWASLDGYEDGSCTKDSIATGDNWCSIALTPGGGGDGGGDGGGGTGGEDSGGDEGGPDDTGLDTAEPDLGDYGAGGSPPGTPRRAEELGGCGCASGGSAPAGLAGLLVGLGIVGLRRRHGVRR